MTDGRNYLWRNTVTNYLMSGVRILQGILLTRWMYHWLGADYYGFYALLWSVFVYALLLDFGFSKATQKYTAAGLWQRDLAAYNRIVSSVFSLLVLMGGIIALGTVAAGVWLSAWTRVVDPEEVAYCRAALYIFGFGTAITFPVNMFAELLVGLHKLYIRNYVTIVARVVDLVVIAVALWCGGRLLTLVICTVAVNMSACFVIAWLCSREIPGLRVRFRLSLPTLRELADFSGFIYLISISNLVLMKTDRLVLGIFAGLESVGFYQLGSRVPELSQTMASQYQETISPMSAALHAQNNTGRLRRVIFRGLRVCSFMGTGGMLAAGLLAPEILLVLFNITEPEVVTITRWLLASAYVTVAFRSVAGRFLMMSGRHRFLAYMLMGEAASNLGLSIWWVRDYGVLGVVWGTLIPNIAVAILLVMPYIIKFIHMGWWRVVDRVYLRPLWAAAAMGAVIWCIRELHPWLPPWCVLLLACGVGGGVYLAVCFGVMLSRRERIVFMRKLIRR